MKVKYITAAFAFAVTFGFSVLLIGIPQENYATRTFAIRADNETGRQISFSCNETTITVVRWTQILSLHLRPPDSLKQSTNTSIIPEKLTTQTCRRISETSGSNI